MSIYIGSYNARLTGIYYYSYSTADSVESQLWSRTLSGNYSNSRVVTIGDGAFYSFSKLATVSFPNVTTIGSSAFQNCSALTEVSVPKAETIGSYAFQSCSKLTTADFPATTAISNYAFQGCSSLTTASFPEVTEIGSYAFRNCTRLVSLYLLGPTLANLLGSTALNSTPIGGYSTIASKYGSIYVPASLYSSYISASYWSYFSSRFVSV